MAKMMDEIEAETIGAMFVRSSNIVHAIEAGCKCAWFTKDRWSLMWEAIEGFWRNGKVDELNIVDAIEEAKRLAAREKERRSADALTVGEIADAAEKSPVVILSHLRHLENDYIERSAKKAIADSFKEFPVYASAADVVAIARGKLDGILNGTYAAKKIPPRAVFAEIMAEYEEAHKMRVAADGPRDLKWTPGIKMPWPKMTEFMNGLRPGLHIVAARPSVGKTAYAVNLMHFWCEQGIPVLFCSLDMPVREVLRRYIAERARVSARKAAFSPTAADLDAMRKAVAAMDSWPLSVIETRDVDELRTIALVEKSAERLGVVVVDYLQLLHARALGREDAVEYSRVSYVSDTLKRLANELQVPVVALAQLNRESTKNDAAGRMPGLADLRGSGAIEQDAFTVTILHRDQATVEKWRKGADIEHAKRLIPGTIDNPAYRYNMDDIDPIWWVLCKAQNGPTGALPFVVRKKYFCWMLGDYDAEAKTETSGYGAAIKTSVDNSAKFERVHSDWRHDPIEEVLRLQLALIESGDEVQNMEEDA